MPGYCVFDLGVSEAIYSNISPSAILEKPSPVIFMRAKKNPTEQKGMRRAQVLDGVAMCDALSLLERRVSESIFSFIQFITSILFRNISRFSIRKPLLKCQQQLMLIDHVME